MDAIDAIWIPAQEPEFVIQAPLKDRVIFIHAIAIIRFSETSGGYYYDVVRFEYEVTKSSRDWSWQPGWKAWISAHDDVGTEYIDLGGAYRVSRMRDRMEGEYDFTAPPPQATWLDFVFHTDKTFWTQPEYRLRITLPLPEVTLEQWTAMTRKYSLR
jgi:hypothetical protein